MIRGRRIRWFGVMVAALWLVLGYGGTDLPKAEAFLDGLEGYEADVEVTPGQASKLTMTSPKPKKAYRLGIAVPHLRDPYWVAHVYGQVMQAKALGLPTPIVLAAGGYLMLENQIRQVEDLIQQKVDAILLSPNSYEGTVAIVEEAVAKGIPVITPTNLSKTAKVSSAVVQDNFRIGRLQAEYIIKKTGGKGTIVMLNGPAGASWSMERVEGFKKAIKAAPGIKVAAEQWSEMDRSKALKIMEDFMQAHGDIQYAYTSADILAKGAADAIINAGKKGRIRVTSATFAPDALEYVKGDVISLDIGESPVIVGKWSIDMAVRLLNGEKIPKVVYVPLPDITSENVDKVDTSWQWAPMGWEVPR